MKRTWKTGIVAVGLVGIMATASYAASEIAPTMGRSFDGGVRLTPIERIMDKVGVSKTEWMELRKAGKTPEDIAKDYNVDVDAIKAEMKEEMLLAKFKLIDEKVAAGEMTAEEAASLKEDIKARMENCEGRGMKGFGKVKGRMMDSEKMGPMMKDRGNWKNQKDKL